MDELNAAHVSEHLQRMFLGCLLFRLGGEQSFTPEEIDLIRAEVKGVQFFVTDDNRIVLRVRNEEFIQAHSEPGKGTII
jgi:hypothetical protein